MSDFGDQQDGPSASLASSSSDDDRRVDPDHDIGGDPTGSPTVGLTTFSRLQRGERFSLATGGGVIPDTSVDRAVTAPERLDAYEIVERLGEGDMGIVYLADQLEPVRRRVALKVSKSALADARAVHRFEAERQAMARLAHPYIAQIFAAGASEDGHPYFVMEHVDGRPITTYCDEHGLSLSDRLSLFRDVCAGVQHAHQKGILHRDIKPSNILVTEVEVAEASYRRAHEIFSAVYGPDHPETAMPLFNLAELQRGRGDLQLAEATYLQALAIWQEAHGPEHSDVAYILDGLGEVYRDMGRLDEAEDHDRRALAIRERNLGPGSQDLRSTLKGLATVLAATGRAAESEALLARMASPAPSSQ